MAKYRVEFGFGENFQSVEEFQTMDELMAVEAKSAEAAAQHAACIDGLMNAIFRVYELDENGEFDRHNPELFSDVWPDDDWESDDPIETQKDRIENIENYLSEAKNRRKETEEMVASDPILADADWVKYNFKTCDKSIAELEERLKYEKEFLERMCEENEIAI